MYTKHKKYDISKHTKNEKHGGWGEKKHAELVSKRSELRPGCSELVEIRGLAGMDKIIIHGFDTPGMVLLTRSSVYRVVNGICRLVVMNVGETVALNNVGVTFSRLEEK